MLTTRSKILITVAAGYGLIALILHALSAGTWNPEPDSGHWYDWIFLGVLVIAAVLSIVVDARRNRAEY